MNDKENEFVKKLGKKTTKDTMKDAEIYLDFISEFDVSPDNQNHIKTPR